MWERVSVFVCRGESSQDFSTVWEHVCVHVCARVYVMRSRDGLLAMCDRLCVIDCVWCVMKGYSYVWCGWCQSLHCTLQYIILMILQCDSEKSLSSSSCLHFKSSFTKPRLQHNCILKGPYRFIKEAMVKNSDYKMLLCVTLGVLFHSLIATVSKKWDRHDLVGGFVGSWWEDAPRHRT